MTRGWRYKYNSDIYHLFALAKGHRIDARSNRQIWEEAKRFIEKILDVSLQHETRRD